jgi:hypothetical protein
MSMFGKFKSILHRMESGGEDGGGIKMICMCFGREKLTYKAHVIATRRYQLWEKSFGSVDGVAFGVWLAGTLDLRWEVWVFGLQLFDKTSRTCDCVKEMKTRYICSNHVKVAS